jgi:hypothetical protein
MNKKHLQTILIGLVVCSGTFALGQSTMYFSKAYCPEKVATYGTNIMLTDSGYIIAGAYKDSLTNKQRLLIMHIDPFGNINTLKTHGNDTMKYYPSSGGSFIQANDSDYFWATQKSNAIKPMGVLIRMDRSFNPIWEVDYSYNNDTTYSFFALTNVISTHDYGFVMVGAITSSQNINDLLIQKTDSLGNVQWRKSFVYKGVSWVYSVIQTPDHGFLLGGGAGEPYIKHSYHGIIIKTDSLGNEQWRRYIGSPDYDDSYCIVKNSPDGNYIVGTMLGVDQYYNSWYDFAKIRLFKVSNAGNVLWDKTYGEPKLSAITTQVIVHPNGDNVACGFYSGPTDTVDTFSWILKTNHNGDSIWLREHYRYNGYLNTNRLQDLKPTPDGGYILVGATDSFMYIPQSAWVLKVDSLGCAVPGCHLVGLKEVIMPPEEILLYPNPATTSITLRLPNSLIQEQKEVRVFNHAGQEVLRQPLPTGEPEPTLDIFHLPAGLYYLRVIHRDISTVLGKFVKN